VEIVASAVESAGWCRFHHGMDCAWSLTTILSRWFIWTRQMWQTDMDRTSRI